MKKLISSLILILASTSVLANGNSHYNGNDGGTGSEADAAALALTSSGSIIDSHDNVSTLNKATDLSRAVPSIVVPNPAVGFAVCDSAYTLGGSVAGFGAAIGIPISDNACNLREDAKTTKLLGEPVIAKELMCTDVRFFKSSYRAGRPCFPDSDMIDELSDDELVIYKELLAYKAEQAALVARELTAPKRDTPQDLIRGGKIPLQ